MLERYTGEEALLPVVIEDGGRESPSTDPVAHHMDPFTEPGLNPKKKNPHIYKQTDTNDEEQISVRKKVLY